MRDITMSFGATMVLRGVNLEINPAHVTALLGANGAGKSTLIKILSGVYERDSGEVVFKGQPVAFRKNVTGVLESSVPVYWNIEKK